MKQSIQMAGIFFPLVLIMVIACDSGQQTGEQGAVPGIEDALNAEFEGIYDLPVRLAEGFYEGKPFSEGNTSRPTVRLVRDIIAKGDMNGDGKDETVVLLLEDSGGSGSFLYIAVLVRRSDMIENRGTILAGDRVQVRNMRIAGGRLIMDMVQHGPGDAMCCPTQKARRSWTLAGNDLVEGTPEISGKLSLDDLRGGGWMLKQIGTDKPYSGDPPVSLVFEDGRISGSGGCNTYFGEVKEYAPGTIEIPGLGMTRMTCPDYVMDIENRYLEALSGASGYGFIAGRLALSCQTEYGPVTLVFTRGE